MSLWFFGGVNITAYVYFLLRSNHSGNNGTIQSSTISDSENFLDNGDHILNNNLENGLSEICDVPDQVANQKRHVSYSCFLTSKILKLSAFSQWIMLCK